VFFLSPSVRNIALVFPSFSPFWHSWRLYANYFVDCSSTWVWLLFFHCDVHVIYLSRNIIGITVDFSLLLSSRQSYQSVQSQIIFTSIIYGVICHTFPLFCHLVTNIKNCEIIFLNLFHIKLPFIYFFISMWIHDFLVYSM
jgi:hypothetical protein